MLLRGLDPNQTYISATLEPKLLPAPKTERLLGPPPQGPCPTEILCTHNVVSVATSATGGATSSVQTFRNLLLPAEQAEFEALREQYPDWMPKTGLDTSATIRSVAENAQARAEFTGRGHHPQPLKFGGGPNPSDLNADR